MDSGAASAGSLLRRSPLRREPVRRLNKTRGLDLRQPHRRRTDAPVVVRPTRITRPEVAARNRRARFPAARRVGSLRIGARAQRHRCGLSIKGAGMAAGPVCAWQWNDPPSSRRSSRSNGTWGRPWWPSTIERPGYCWLGMGADSGRTSQPCVNPVYSPRRATVGSTRAARRAGMALAAKAATDRATTAARNALRSWDSMPKRKA